MANYNDERAERIYSMCAKIIAVASVLFGIGVYFLTTKTTENDRIRDKGKATERIH